MIKKANKSAIRKKRHSKLRHRTYGTRAQRRIYGTEEMPRLVVFRSNNHIYAQVINDDKGLTLASASTMEKAISDKLEKTSNVEAAKVVGEIVGQRAKDKGIEKVVFDRGGYVYHGKVKALADGAREAGLQF